jgi:hypothetical protein
MERQKTQKNRGRNIINGRERKTMNRHIDGETERKTERNMDKGIYS